VSEYDLVVVGAGLAGLTAGMYAARFGLKTLVLEQMAAGGQVLNVEKIDNFPGFPQGVSGFDLGPLVQEQAEGAGVEFAMHTATALEISDGEPVVRCDGANFAARAVIIAVGSTFRMLGIPGEAEFLGRGVSHCASCDAPFFVGKDVCVIGGGDSALDEAAVLAQQVGRVLVIHRGSAFRAQQIAVERLASLSNVEVAFNTHVLAIEGDESVSGVRVRSNGSEHVQDVSGVFVFVGLEPNTAFVRGVLDLDAAGHIVVDERLQSSVAGVFAAGDIRQHSVAQLVSAAGDGATAAVNAVRYLRGA
jgi:thioredoxin reductase (NADPH)